MDFPDYPDRAQLQYAQVKNICYPNPEFPAEIDRDVTETRSMTTAATDRRKLTEVNAGRFRGYDIEQRLVTIIHEVAHTGAGTDWNKGNHKPSFWSEFVSCVQTLLDSERHKTLVQSVFTGDIDWHRVMYRAIQHPSSSYVDGRIETVDERKRKIADAFDYEHYDTFENRSFYLAAGGENTTPFSDPKCVSLHLPAEDRRFATRYTDEDLIEFIDEYGKQDESGSTYIPAPLIMTEETDGGERDPSSGMSDGWLIVRDDLDWHFHGDTEYGRMAFALYDRAGRNPVGTAWSERESVPEKHLPDAYVESGMC